MPADFPRILIVTAAFGEGHNSAARNVSMALQSAGAITRVADPCLLGAPGITAVVSRGYRMVTNRLPRVWAMIYRSTDRCDFSKRSSPVMRFPEKALGALIDEFRPDALVSTYPLYPYFLKRIPQGIGAKFPVFTVVTDSIEINAAWLRAPSDWWLVTDPSTRDAVIRKGLPPERVVDTGFPVSPLFAELSPSGRRERGRGVPDSLFRHSQSDLSGETRPGSVRCRPVGEAHDCVREKRPRSRRSGA
jgi:processive 1,2-diacylglycerol beta-glucosyltransferase